MEARETAGSKAVSRDCPASDAREMAMNKSSHLSKILFVLIFGLVLLGASVTTPADKSAPAGPANEGVNSERIVLAQFVPCPNGRCRR